VRRFAGSLPEPSGYPPGQVPFGQGAHCDDRDVHSPVEWGRHPLRLDQNRRSDPGQSSPQTVSYQW